MESQVPGGASPPQVARVQVGQWEGEYLDTNGYRGKVRLTLDSGGDVVRGRYEITIRAEDAPQVFSGDLEGKSVGDRLTFGVALGRDKARAEFAVQVRSAGSYAQQAMVGIVNAPPGSSFGGGVWIAWRFANQSPRGQ